MDYSLCYQGCDLNMTRYIDVQQEGDQDEKKFTSRYVFVLNNGVIYQASKKQTSIALSTIEAEFVAIFTGVQVVWLKQFLIHLGFCKDASQVVVNCDS